MEQTNHYSVILGAQRLEITINLSTFLYELIPVKIAVQNNSL